MIDDTRIVAAAQEREQALGQIHQAEEVRLKGPPQRVDRHVLRSALQIFLLADAGIVDEHIESAEAILDQLPRSLERCGCGNVDNHRFDLCTALRKHSRGLPSARFIARTE